MRVDRSRSCERNMVGGARIAAGCPAVAVPAGDQLDPPYPCCADLIRAAQRRNPAEGNPRSMPHRGGRLQIRPLSAPGTSKAPAAGAAWGYAPLCPTMLTPWEPCSWLGCHTHAAATGRRRHREHRAAAPALVGAARVRAAAPRRRVDAVPPNDAHAVGTMLTVRARTTCCSTGSAHHP